MPSDHAVMTILAAFEIARLKQYAKVFDGADLKAAVAVWRDALEGVTDVELIMAGKAHIRTERDWPTPAEIRAQVITHRQIEQMKTPRLPEPQADQALKDKLRAFANRFGLET